MSAAVSVKGEKSAKKFNSLNINTIYTGSSTKPPTKNHPPKQGYTTLGKIVTPRRAPANLPSIKSENCGNDPAINLVPSGGSGWASSSTTGGGSVSSSSGVSSGVSNIGILCSDKSGGPSHSLTNAGTSATDASEDGTQGGHSGSKKEDLLLKGNSSEAPKTWRNVSQDPPSVTHKPNYIASPLFGQDFPSLTEEPGSSGPKRGSASSSEHGGSSLAPGSSASSSSLDTNNKYGPGPNLRPQTSGSWKQTGSISSSSGGSSSLHNNLSGGLKVGGPPSRPSESAFEESLDAGRRTSLVSQAPRFDVSVKPQSHFFPPRGSPKSSSSLHRIHQSSSSPRSSKVLFAHASIIDDEKLRRMDDIDTNNDDDWTRGDDAFDYNKKLTSDDEEESTNSGKTDYTNSNWASSNSNSNSEQQQILQAPPSQTSNAHLPIRPLHQGYPPTQDFGGSNPLNNNNNNCSSNSSNHGGTSGDATSFLDDEDQKRIRKNEEVLKNIERARKRRQEEELKYGNGIEKGVPQGSRVEFGGYERKESSPSSVRGNAFPGKAFDVNGAPPPPFYLEEEEPRYRRDEEEHHQHYDKSSSSRDGDGKSRAGSASSFNKRSDEYVGATNRNSPSRSRVQQSEHSDIQPEGSATGATGSESRGSTPPSQGGPRSKDYGSFFRTVEKKASPEPENKGHAFKAREEPSTSPAQQGQSFEASSSDASKSVSNSSSSKQAVPKEEEPSTAASNQRRGGQSARGEHDKKSSSNNKKPTSSHSHSTNGGGNNTNRGPSSKKNPPSTSSNVSSSRGGASSSGGPRGGGGSRNEKYRSSRGSGGRGVRRNKAPPNEEEDYRHDPSEQHHYHHGPSSTYDEQQQHGGGGGEHRGEDDRAWFAPRGQPSRRGRGGGGRSGGGRHQEEEKMPSKKQPEWVAGDSNSEASHEDPHHQQQQSHHQSGHHNHHHRGGGSGVYEKQRTGGGKQQKNPPPPSSNNNGVSSSSSNCSTGNNNNYPSSSQKSDRRSFYNNESNNYHYPPNNEEEAAHHHHQQQRRYEGKKSGGGRGGDSRHSEGTNKSSSSSFKNTAKLPPRLVKQREQREQLQNRKAAREWSEGAGGHEAPRWAPAANNAEDHHHHHYNHQQHQAPPHHHHHHFHEKQQQQQGELSSAPASKSSSSPVQTIIFENTNYKGGGSEGLVMTNGVVKGPPQCNAGLLKEGSLQLPIGYPKGGGNNAGEDSADLQLDFTFEPSELGPSEAGGAPEGKEGGHPPPPTSKGPPHLNSSSSRGVVLPPQPHHHGHPHQHQQQVVQQAQNHMVGGHHPAAEDLNMKIASVKKVWESVPSMSPDNVVVATSSTAGPPVSAHAGGGVFVPGFPAPGSNEEEQPGNEIETGMPVLAPPNKGRGPHMQNPHAQQQMPPHHQQSQQQQAAVAFNRLIQQQQQQQQPTLSSPSMQPTLYQQFQLSDGRNTLYSPYAPAPSLGVPASVHTADMFGGSQFRSGYNPNSPGALLQHHQSSPAGLMKTSSQQSNQIGPIGTKAGNFSQSGLASPGASLIIPFDAPRAAAAAAASINYMQRAAAAGGNPGGSPAYYTAAALGNPQRQQAYNITNYPPTTQLRNQAVHSYVTKTMAAPPVNNEPKDKAGIPGSSSFGVKGLPNNSNPNGSNNLSMRGGGGNNSAGPANYNPTPIQRPHLMNTGDELTSASEHDKKSMASAPEAMDENQ